MNMQDEMKWQPVRPLPPKKKHYNYSIAVQLQLADNADCDPEGRIIAKARWFGGCGETKPGWTVDDGSCLVGIDDQASVIGWRLLAIEPEFVPEPEVVAEDIDAPKRLFDILTQLEADGTDWVRELSTEGLNLLEEIVC